MHFPHKTIFAITSFQTFFSLRIKNVIPCHRWLELLPAWRAGKHDGRGTWRGALSLAIVAEHCWSEVALLIQWYGMKDECTRHPCSEKWITVFSQAIALHQLAKTKEVLWTQRQFNFKMNFFLFYIAAGFFVCFLAKMAILFIIIISKRTCSFFKKQHYCCNINFANEEKSSTSDPQWNVLTKKKFHQRFALKVFWFCSQASAMKKSYNTVQNVTTAGQYVMVKLCSQPVNRPACV